MPVSPEMRAGGSPQPHRARLRDLGSGFKQTCGALETADQDLDPISTASWLLTGAQLSVLRNRAVAPPAALAQSPARHSPCKPSPLSHHHATCAGEKPGPKKPPLHSTTALQSGAFISSKAKKPRARNPVSPCASFPPLLPEVTRDVRHMTPQLRSQPGRGTASCPPRHAASPAPLAAGQEPRTGCALGRWVPKLSGCSQAPQAGGCMAASRKNGDRGHS